MAIQEFFPQSMPEEEIDRLVGVVVKSLGSSMRDFEHASQEYNLDFFQGEPDEFRRRLCKALSNHFSHVATNAFWNQNAEIV